MRRLAAVVLLLFSGPGSSCHQDKPPEVRECEAYCESRQGMLRFYRLENWDGFTGTLCTCANGDLYPVEE